MSNFLQRISALMGQKHTPDEWFEPNPESCMKPYLERVLFIWAHTSLGDKINDMTLAEVFRKHGHELPNLNNEFESVAMAYGSDLHPYNIGYKDGWRGLRKRDLNKFPLHAQGMYLAGFSMGQHHCHHDDVARYQA